MSSSLASTWPIDLRVPPRKFPLVVGGLVVLFFGLGQLINLPIYVLAALPIAAALGLWIMQSGKIATFVFIACGCMLAFGKGTTNSATAGGGFDLAMAGVFSLVTMVWIGKLLIVERRSFTYDSAQLLAVSYTVWGLFIGIGGMLWWNNPALDWAREFFILCPIVLVPAFYERFFTADSEHERHLHRFAFVAAILVMVWATARYAINIATAAYAYQIGRFTFDTSASIIVLLVCFAFTLHRVKWIPMYVRIALASFCVGTLVIASYRTIWAASVLSVIVLFMIAPRTVWSSGLRFLLILGGVLASIGTYMFFQVKIFQVFVMMQYQRLLSSTELKTDPSLVNRYIETDIVWDYIKGSPIVGYGFGAKFQLFDWLLGMSFDYSYSHNGFFFVAFKTGIVGFLLIFTAYFWFMYKGFRIARDLTESPRVRALAGVGFCYLLCMLVSNYTLNIFAERNVLIWITLFWGFFLSREIAKKKRANSEASTEVATLS